MQGLAMGPGFACTSPHNAIIRIPRFLQLVEFEVQGGKVHRKGLRAESASDVTLNSEGDKS